jgi:hypothetical protein
MTRRSFIKRAALAIGALFVPAAVLGSEANEIDVVKVYSGGLKRTPDFTIPAPITDEKLQEIAKRLGSAAGRHQNRIAIRAFYDRELK